MSEVNTGVPAVSGNDGGSASSDPITAAISDVAAGLNDGDATGDDGGTEALATEAADPAVPATEEPVTQDGKPETEPEIRGRISAKRHQEILTRQREKQAAEHTAAVKALTDRLEKLAWAESPEAEVQRVMERLEANPEAIAQALAQHPKYAGLIQLKAAQEAAAEAAKPAAGGHPYGEMPGPNIRMPDGSLAYDAEGMKKWGEWIANVSAYNATQDAQAKFDGRLKPIEEKEAAAQKYGETYREVETTLAHARKNWPEFASLEADIKPIAMQLQGRAESRLLRGYTQVLVEKVIPALREQVKVNRDAVRQEVIAELNQKAGAAGERVETGPVGGSAPHGSDDPIASVIRQQARRLSRTAA